MFRHRLRSSGTRSKVASGEARRRHRRRHWVLEGLEGRVLLSGATVYTVDLTTDKGTGSDNKGDLLYCITQANVNTNTAGSEIEFDPAIFQVATQQSITLSATLDLLETAGPEVIDGPGASDLKITGNDTVQVFSVSSDTTATFSSLTIWGGMTGQSGAGIDSEGTVTVTSCTFNSNTANDGMGGGIANDGMMTITNSTFVNNSADFGGGIENEGTLTVTGSQFQTNTATFGGGIDNEDGGAATLTSTTLTSNSASSFGGGIFYSGTSPLSVTSSTLSSNTAAESGGGIYNEGDGHDGGNKLTIANSTLSDNSADGGSSSSGGGGLYDRGGTTSISGSTFSGNTAAQSGGGIFSNAGALTIMDSTLSNNTLSGAGAGGGLYENGGTLTVTNSTIAGNSAGGVGAGIGENAGTLTAVNCTIAENTEPSTGDGLGGGLNVGGTATLDNTIIALNTDGTGPGAVPDDLKLAGSGTVPSSSASNLIGTGGSGGLTNGSNGNLVGVADPGLGRLADNGGPTQTIALLAGSPAIAAGNKSLAVDPQGNALTTDQRGTGFPRLLNGNVDIGAFERPVVSTSPTVYIVDLISDTGASTSANDGDILYCVTQANANPNLAGSEIEFAPTVFSTATPQTIKLSSTLELNPPSGPELIEGPGASIVTVSGNGGVGAIAAVFSVDSDLTASLTGLTISLGQIGVDNAGTMTVTNCNIDKNGGGIESAGMMTVTGSTIDDNGTAVIGDYGGGIDNSGTMTVTDCTLSGNSAGAGGGIDNSGPLTITGSTLSGNSAKVFGGAIDNYAPLTVTGSTIEENSVGANGWGGGIHNESSLTVTGSTIENNSVGDGGFGGGVYNSGTAATITGSTLSDNSGGGIYVSTGTVTVTASTIDNNVGGGIEITSDGSTTITNSTVTGNTVGSGGGIVDDGGFLKTVNCTIAGNSVGLNVSNGGTAILDNTIVATNTTDDIAGPLSRQVLNIGSSAFNLIGTGGAGGLTNGSNGNLVGVADPGLGALANNGGPTQTIALLAGSPAIGAGSIALAVGLGGSALTTDQRGTGFARDVDGKIDIGAFELQAVTTNPVPTLTTISPKQTVVGYASPLTLTVTGSGFLSQSVVDWNSTALATAYVSSTELTATIPGSDFLTMGSFPVTVVNPTPGGGTSNAATFQVLAVPTSVYVNASYAADPLGKAVTWTDGSTHFVGYDAFGTVQAGVEAVASGGTVDIAAGTYTEVVNIAHSLTLVGAGAGATTIQAPASLTSGDLVAIESGASVTMSGFTVHDGLFNGTGIADEGGTLSATDLNITDCTDGVAVEDKGTATITYCTISGNMAAGIVVGSSSSDTSTLTANYNNLTGNLELTGLANIQATGTINATFNWWGSARGPTNPANPVGTGSGVVGSAAAPSAANVDFSPWLGDTNLQPYDYLVFSSTSGSNYVVTPLSDNTGLNITSGVIAPFRVSLATIPGGDTLGFAGNGGTITVDGEAGPSSDIFVVKDTSVEFFNSDDGLFGTTINFIGTGLTRDVAAQGQTNWFEIEGAGASGPSGTLEGDSGTNVFFFDALGDGEGSEVQGNIEGGGAGTLNYSAYPADYYSPAINGVEVFLGNGTDGTATGVSGSVSGIKAVIGSINNDLLEAGNVPGVTLTGGLGYNELVGSTGAGDSVAESVGATYGFTSGGLTGETPTGEYFQDTLSDIHIANLTGSSPTDNFFNVSDWNGSGSLTSPTGIGTVIASKNDTFVLSNSSLRTSDGMSLSLSGITDALVTGTGNEDGFAINDWTGEGTLSDTSGVLGVGVEDSSITLTNAYVEAGPMFLVLNGFNIADLYEESNGSPSPGGYTFNVSGWTHQGGLTGDNIASVTASESADITLTNSSLTSGTLSMGLSGITSADLTVSAAASNPPLIIDASAFSGATNLAATGTGNAILYGGSGGGGTLTAAGSGKDVLIGKAADTTLTDTGTGRNILIGGGAGDDTLVGNGNDILVSGTTVYDSYNSDNIAALDAILAEWTSGNSYALRINKIKRGVGPDHHDAFNSHTIQPDANANTLSDRTILLLQTDSNANARTHPNISFPRRQFPFPRPQSNNWFIVSSHDHVTRRSNETKTII